MVSFLLTWTDFFLSKKSDISPTRIPSLKNFECATHLKYVSPVLHLYTFCTLTRRCCIKQSLWASRRDLCWFRRLFPSRSMLAMFFVLFFNSLPYRFALFMLHLCSTETWLCTKNIAAKLYVFFVVWVYTDKHINIRVVRTLVLLLFWAASTL